MLSRIAQPCRGLLWASCRSSWPSPTWQKPHLVCHVLALCPFAAAWAAHHEDDGGLEDVCGARGRRERGWCLEGSVGTDAVVSTA